jgi:uncharacterized repeat protein (TIGR03803 family)
MQTRKISIGLIVVLAMFAMATLTTATRAAAQTERVLHNFHTSTGEDGDNPLGALIFDASGNLYGTTPGGGTYAGGTVFELIPQAGGAWEERVLHNFPDGKDGVGPQGALIFDASGNLYGATDFGGAYGIGTVFELTPKTGGWGEKILHSFSSGKDGFYPNGGLIFDTAGNLYGTTYSGDALYGYGRVFELTPKTGGWGEKILQSFVGGNHGAYPTAGLIFDTAGNLYGTTLSTVFELTPESEGWAETILHSFSNNGTDGTYPEASLIFDAAGNLYGTTYSGGTGPCVGGCGTVFELTPTGGGTWTETILYNFGNRTDGIAGLIFDASGNLYGATALGGTGPCSYYGVVLGCGIVFELMPQAGGGWTETVLHSFSNTPDGAWPKGSLIFDAAGNLYGTTELGGAYGNGTVFEITP